MTLIAKAKRADGASTHRELKLRRALSAHEIAALLRLQSAPGAANAATPDLQALQEVGLVQLVASEHCGTKYSLADEGKAVLRMLGTEPLSRC